ncbi:antibiotic biosynthesis monooxygenase [Leptospira inadai serovar Lyme str. 10]|uniref:Antibiotic biosynthesis monooxygenase n=2 Tax=Leptospira inadai serovar Lyme TaxID=293084 RepID=V6H9Q2_9LEPT|nr:antibiotic biosynthesis monooxygenase family protein [Leptospira inadai]EQA35762.1 antibiotic biosynthesis monooxygenase [Leptospira inadai serovar Lyme str. 10]PNV76821.1 antibiotic biosynthesis monooxygenase [Leptospira inadai serovar Lyme]
MAFVRIGKFKAKQERVVEICLTYEKEAIPMIRKAEGNISAALLQEKTAPDSFLAISVWQTEEDAVAYERSGLAQEMVNKIRSDFAAPPTLITYNAFGI